MFPLRRVLCGSLVAAVVATAGAARGQNVTAAPPQAPPPTVMENVAFDQRLDAALPLDAEFVDETGKTVRLGDYFGDRPVVLNLVYYECPMMCTEVLNGLVAVLREIPFQPGKDFEIVTVSFDPSETPELAANKKDTYVKQYARPGVEAGWHFLTGDVESIRRLTDTVGFRYLYDKNADQFAHASGIILCTSDGRTSRYFYGIDYPVRDVRLGLVEASQNKIGSPVDYLLLLCYHYDPLTGQYSMVIINVLRLAGIATVVVLASFVGLMVLRERRKRTKESELEIHA